MNELTNLARRLLSQKQEQSDRELRAAKQTAVPEQDALDSGCVVWWRSMNGQEHGPAVVEGTFRDHEDIWFWCRCDGRNFLVNTRLIVTKQRES